MIWVIAITGILLLGGIGVGALQGIQRIYGDTSLILSNQMRQDILTGYLQFWLFYIFIKSLGIPLSKGECAAIGIGLAFAYRLVISKIRSRQYEFAAKTQQWAHVLFNGIMLSALGGGGMGWWLGTKFARPSHGSIAYLNILDHIFYLSLLGFVIGGLCGAIVMRETQTALAGPRKKIRSVVYGSIAGALVVGWLNSMSHSYYPLLMIWAGLISGLLIAGWMIGSRPLTAMANVIGKGVAKCIVLVLSRIRFSTIICGDCYRYTKPHRSRYDRGKRYCEFCQSKIPFTHDPGKVILIFGNIPLKLNDRVFTLSNPNFEQKDQPIDVSQVYVDPKTCDPRLLERFITYIINYPPEHGIQSIKLLYSGSLDDLGNHLKNALQNNFAHLEKHISSSFSRRFCPGEVKAHPQKS